MGGLFIPERPDELHRQLAGAPGLVLFGARCVMVQACVICALGKPHVATCEHACHGFKIADSSVAPPSVAALAAPGRATNPLVSIHCRAAPLAAWAGGCHGTTARQPLQWASLPWLRADLEARRRRLRRRQLLGLSKPPAGRRPPTQRHLPRGRMATDSDT